MSKVVKFLQEQIEDHHRVLAETEEDAHTHALFLNQLNYKEKFVKAHFPDNEATQDILKMIRRMRALTSKALEHKE